MDKKDKKRISEVSSTAAKIKKKNPKLTFQEALDQAKEIYKSEVAK